MTNPHESNEKEKLEILTVTIPASLMRDLEVFCSEKDIPIKHFLAEALSEKMHRWKE